jgi:hypothetical protein
VPDAKTPALLNYFRDDHSVDQHSNLHEWELLIRQARYANLLSRLAFKLKQKGLLSTLEEKPRLQLDNAIKVANANSRAARWEVADVYKLLRANNIPFILLKGGAYLWINNSASTGRLFGDTDIMVKKGDLHAAEVLFAHNGWVTTKLENYDQKYYRNWMHELPPLHHTTRHTSLDVHHDILPPISHTGFDIEDFWTAAIEDKAYPGLFTLQPIDMILHSATHLFQEGEFEQALRDLVDLDLLIKEYIQCQDDWKRLAERAQALHLSRFLCYALVNCQQILETEVAPDILQKVTAAARLGPLKLALVKWFYRRAIMPDHETTKLPGASFARFVLFLRAHWIKMPWYILIYHFARKYLVAFKLSR